MAFDDAVDRRQTHAFAHGGLGVQTLEGAEELVPVRLSAARSYFLKEVYYNSVLPERAAEELRKANIEESSRT